VPNRENVGGSPLYSNTDHDRADRNLASAKLTHNAHLTDLTSLRRPKSSRCGKSNGFARITPLGKSTYGVPRLIAPLCTPLVTAMSEETGVKVTGACRRSPIRRRIAGQLIEALIAEPLLSRNDSAVFHADPNRELVILDWALAERLNLEPRRRLVMLALMMILRQRDGVCQAAQALGKSADHSVIPRCVNHFFENMPSDHRPGVLDAMWLLDRMALEGVRFPAALFLFRKIVFTLDGVLHDVDESNVRIDEVIAREYLTRWAASAGLFHAPLLVEDFTALLGKYLASL